ncbi:hypothetical protein PB2503_07434 [Parvularcula bermudensis HTCC2503]|uniref:Ancillary SecYEG translocon subunit/Cell division coordinator CpoB TPR domain-containing protein n=1 Tax=Parvularcula bermudensis (strain ATCC BAA-594 / HTCC2503 / KCTC 12087) TaxID=314260 RepID=E0TFE3_PARBH|nr:tetratricopeptide repeat protein [Parvularcula bermudensis]ADM09544.1 hypothetical protein PB2503_07434 [Parvularcula bermudensis HTCC2503]
MAEWSPRIKQVTDEQDKQQLAFVNSLLTERRFDDASKEADKLLANNPKSFGAHMAKGRALQGLRKFKDALNCFLQAAQIDPLQPSAHLMAGICAFVVPDLPLAEKKFRTTLDIDSKSSAAHVGLSQVLVRNGDNNQAREHLDKALRINPEMSMAVILKARLDLKDGDADSAIIQLQDQVRRTPNNRTAEFALIGAYMQDERWQEAEALLSRMVSDNPNDAIMHGLLGRVRVKRGDFKGAEEAYRQAPVSHNRIQNLARNVQMLDALVPQGKYEEARKILSQVPKMGPLAAIVNTRYGDVYKAEGNYQQAIASYRAALLRDNQGEAMVAAVEQAVADAGRADDSPFVAQRFADAANEALEKKRKSFADQDWQEMLEKYRPNIMAMMEDRDIGG